MDQTVKSVCYDPALRLEAYRLSGIAQPFPNHFHDYYVIGLVEAGIRSLVCRNRTYVLGPGDMLVFHPGDNHGCRQTGAGTLCYRGMNIRTDTMLDLAEEITGVRELPRFSRNVIADEELGQSLRALHEAVMTGGERLEKEEKLLLFLSALMGRYGTPAAKIPPSDPAGLEAACRFMETHYAEPITLDQLCRCCGRSKSSLLRTFTREKGVTPYRYLQSVRIGRAKALLEQGVSPGEAALQTGFADQSHFANFFRMYIGLAPGAYGRIFKPLRGGNSNGR